MNFLPVIALIVIIIIACASITAVLMLPAFKYHDEDPYRRIEVPPAPAVE